MPNSEEEGAVESLRSKLAIPEVPDAAGAQLFEKITGEQPDSAPSAGQETTSKGNRLIGTLIWTFVFMVLIIAIVVSLLAVVVRVQELLGNTAFQEYLESPSAAGLVTSVTTFRQQVSELSPNQVVVVSIDYTPATAAEMEPLAEAVVGDLLSRQARGGNGELASRRRGYGATPPGPLRRRLCVRRTLPQSWLLTRTGCRREKPVRFFRTCRCSPGRKTGRKGIPRGRITRRGRTLNGWKTWQWSLK